MSSFARKVKANQHKPFEGVTRPVGTHGGQSRAADPALNLQSTIGNQAVQRLFEANNEEPGGGSAGERLEPGVRASMESRFEHDFSHVRVHTDEASAQAAQSWNARAYTMGGDIHFGVPYEPRSRSGQALLAHELTHVVQADAGRSNPALPSSSVGALEQEARQAAAGVSRAGGVPPISGLVRGPSVLFQNGPDEDLGAPTFGNLPQDEPAPTGKHRVKLVQSGGKWRDVVPNRVPPKRTAKGSYDFVVMENGSIWAVKSSSNFGHTEAALGERVKWAGHIQFNKKGQLTGWSNASGHYIPSGEFARNAGLSMDKFQRRHRGPVTRPDFRREGPQLPVFQPKKGDVFYRPGDTGTKPGSTQTGNPGKTVSGEISVPQRGSVTPAGGTPRGATSVSGEIDVPQRGSVTPSGGPARGVTSVSGEFSVPQRGSVTPSGGTPRGVSSASGVINVKGKVNLPKPKVSTPGGMRSPGGRRFPGGRGGRGAAAGIGALVEAVALPIIYSYMQDHFAERFEKDAREQISKAMENNRGKFDALIEQELGRIQTAQAEGYIVRLRVHLNTHWVDTNLGRVLYKTPDLGKYQLVYENGPPPEKYSPPQPGGLVGDLVRGQSGATLSSETIDIELTGTNQAARQQRQSRKQIDAQMHSTPGEPLVPFEKLILKSHSGGFSREDLRDYGAYQTSLAEARGDREEADYWRRMEALATAPIDEVIAQAKVKSIPLDELRAYAAEQGGEGGADRQSASWSDVAGRIDAPLEDRYDAARQRYVWSQPASKQEVAGQKATVDALEARLADLRKQLEEAGKSLYRGDKEPPHPDWSAKWRIEQEIKALREEIWVEKRMLDDFEKKPVGKRKRR
jgi:hypothetical protein